MRIAFISFEYPPDTADGGIATYIYQASRMLADRGHSVEVFCGSRERTGSCQEGPILVHRLQADHERGFSRGKGFAGEIADVFAERHNAAPFDVLEGPEWRADAYYAVRRVPDIPLVLKLHTPSYLLLRISSPPFGSRMHLSHTKQRVLTTLRGGQHYGQAEDAAERLHAKDADEIAAPSQAIGEELVRTWYLDPALVSHVPLPYTPVPELLDIPVETDTGTVTFLGRLEMRKGVIDLAEAIPLVLREHPQTLFRFVGRARGSPRYDMNMREYLEQKLSFCLSPAQLRSSVEFRDPVPLAAVPQVLSETDICVFPSVWESYGFVCLEAMAAARGVIGSSAGGMAELLGRGEVGLLVPPHSPNKVAAAICALLSDPARRKMLGRMARERTLREYNPDRIGALQEQSYLRAIERRRRLGPRPSVSATAPG